MGLKEKTSSEPPASALALCFSGIEKVQITRMRVSKGQLLTTGTPLFHYKKVIDKEGTLGPKEEIYKTQKNGIVVERLIKRMNDSVYPGDVLLFYELCPHETTFGLICADCGQDLSKLDQTTQRKIAQNTNVSMVHSIPELRISKQLAEDYGKNDMNDLLERRKLVLLVDLDQTIIHSTNQNVPADRPDIFHYKLYGEKSPWYHTKFRPHMMEFLAEISKYYQLDVCTFGARRYAHQICKLIDPRSKYFPPDRILSRDEFFDPRSKTGNMKSLFPCGDSMVAIIDDRMDVWNYAKNVIHVKPYLCFKTDDINAPEKLSRSFDAAFGKEDGPQDKGKKKPEEKDGDKDKDKDKDKDEKAEDKDKDKVEEEAKEDVEMKDEKAEDKDDKEAEEKAEDKEEVKEVYENTEKKEEDFLLEDNDDYLPHLERMLKKVHEEFFKAYDEKKKYASDGEEVRLPELKEIIPRIRGQTLAGVHIVFSGVIATNHVPEQNRFHRLAVSMGAKINGDIVSSTTHLVCAKWGSSKVRKAQELPDKIKIVTPHWLLACAERWEKVSEADFEATRTTNLNMIELDDPRKVFFPYYEPSANKAPAGDHLKPGPSSSSSGSLNETLNEGNTLDEEDAKLLQEMNKSSKADLVINKDLMLNMLEEVDSDLDSDSEDDDDVDFNDDDDEEDDKRDNPDEQDNRVDLEKGDEQVGSMAFPPARQDDDEDSNVYGCDDDEAPTGWKAGKKRGREDDDDYGRDSEGDATDDEVDDWDAIENEGMDEY